MLVLIGFAFLAGIVTILSPCILPVLPVVLASTASGGRSRPWGVVTGFILSFTIFTLTLSALVQSLHLDPDFLRWTAAVLVILFGVVLVVPRFKDAFLNLATRVSARFSKPASPTFGKAPGGYWSGVLLGASLGLVWTPCVGPIMASVISLALSSSIDAGSVLITLAYALGTAIPLFIILRGGRALLNRWPFFTRNSGRIQQVFGVLMLATGLLIVTGVDRQIQTGLLALFPNYGSGLTAIEENSAVKDALARRQNVAAPTQAVNAPATDPLTLGQGAWINSPPLTLTALKGKVVLVDFWTYSCINCLRTLPYLKAWNQKYAARGLVIVGVHSPEFAFERTEANVRKAVKDLGVDWPVVQDNGFGIWQAFSNQYWPAHYLYDQSGKLVDTHFGEGKYAETEALIRKLLKIEGGMAGDGLAQGESVADSGGPGTVISPETYLGYDRARNFMGTHGIVQDQTAVYQLPAKLETNEWGLQGNWLVSAESAATSGQTALEFRFSARDVYIVLSPAGQKTSRVAVSLDGKALDGGDVVSGSLLVDGERLYHVFHGTTLTSGTLRFEPQTPLKAYSLTFG